MNETILAYKFLPTLVYIISFIGAIAAGFFVYSGLSSKTERRQTRLRIAGRIKEGKQAAIEKAQGTGAELLLKQAGNPLGLNGLRYYAFYIGLMAFLFIYYIFIPIFVGSSASIWRLVFLIVLTVALMPKFPFSIFRYVIYRLIDYKRARLNSELFMMYDLVINEIEMMSTTRINTYNLLRNLRGFFDELTGYVNRLLVVWSSDEGPIVALDRFADEIGSKEAKALVAVLKTLDENEKETALEALKGMNNMFVRSQIESYRRRRKVFTDISSIPIKTTHFLIILNFMIVVVVMVSAIMKKSNF